MTARFKGFTLVELLIVIAIIGVLAVVVLVAINPVEQLAKTRDSGRISTVTQLGHAMQAYYTSQDAAYPAEATWDVDMTTSGELSTFPSAVSYGAYGYTDGCTENVQPDGDGFCYDLDTTNGAIVYGELESNNQNSKCVAPNDQAFAVFSTGDGRGGIVCGVQANGLNPWAPGAQAYE